MSQFYHQIHLHQEAIRTILAPNPLDPTAPTWQPSLRDEAEALVHESDRFQRGNLCHNGVNISTRKLLEAGMHMLCYKGGVPVWKWGNERPKNKGDIPRSVRNSSVHSSCLSSCHVDR